MRSGPVRHATSKEVKTRTDRKATRSKMSKKAGMKNARNSSKAKPVSEREASQTSVRERGKTDEERKRYYRLEMVGALAGGIAHDINNALTAIMHNVYAAKMFLDDETKRGEVPELLDAGMKTIRRATALTNRLLAFSAEGRPFRRSVYLKNMIKDISKLLLIGSNVRCESHIADGLWPAYVDEGQVAQVISGLIIKTKQLMPEGGTIDLTADNIGSGKDEVPHLKGEKYIRISLKYRSTGMPKENLQNIFNVKKKGSDFGFVTSHSIVRQNGGLIHLESEEGLGMTIHVYLPATETGIRTFPEDARDVGGGNILVMESEEDIVDSMRFALTLLGYETEFVSDGEGVIMAYKNGIKSGRPFDVLILDLTAPDGIGGLEVIRALKSLDPDVKAVIASGYPNNPVMTEFEKYGFSAAIEKPHNVEDLDRLLKRLMATKDG